MLASFSRSTKTFLVYHDPPVVDQCALSPPDTHPSSICVLWGSVSEQGQGHRQQTLRSHNTSYASHFLFMNKINLQWEEGPEEASRMTFWQENYAFIKDVYDMRHHKMAEWIENVEKVRKILQSWQDGDPDFVCRQSPGSWQTKSTPQQSSKERETVSMWVRFTDIQI